VKVFLEYPLKFQSRLLACAKMPGTIESDPDGHFEARMLNNTQSRAQRVLAKRAGACHSHTNIPRNQ
jgi:hypothetical protein